jgi:hypothetical protein
MDSKKNKKKKYASRKLYSEQEQRPCLARGYGGMQAAKAWVRGSTGEPVRQLSCECP